MSPVRHVGRALLGLGLLGPLCLCLVPGCDDANGSSAGSGCGSAFNLLLTGPTGPGASCLNITLSGQGVEENAGICSAADGDTGCGGCLKRTCCGEGEACIDAEDQCTKADPTPAYKALAACAANFCSSVCPS
jgi:hypothetical protein